MIDFMKYNIYFIIAFFIIVNIFNGCKKNTKPEVENPFEWQKDSEYLDITIPSEFSSFEKFSSNQKKFLFWFLCASREWHVSNGYGITAEYRNPLELIKDEKSTQMLINPFKDLNNEFSYVSNDIIQCEITFLIDPNKCGLETQIYRRLQGGNYWIKNFLFTSARASDENVRLFFFPEDYTNQREPGIKEYNSTLLILISEGIRLNIHERSFIKERKITNKVLEKIAKLFSLIKENNTKYLVEELYNNKSIIENINKLNNFNFNNIYLNRVEDFEELRELSSSENYFLSGYINPRSMGELRAIIRDKETSSILGWEDWRNYLATEWIGWSDDKNELFYFEIPLSLYKRNGGFSDKKVEIIFQSYETDLLYSADSVE